MAMKSEKDSQENVSYYYQDDYDYYFYGNGTDGIYEFYTVPQIVFVSILCLFIIVGNICVLAAIRLSKNGRKTRMNFFILHLAIADLLVGVLVSISDLVMKITVEWTGGNVMCKLFQYFQAVVTYSSTYVLVSLSIDRYDAVARPMNFSRSGFQGRLLVYLAWLASFVFASPALFLYHEANVTGKQQCWVDFPEYWHWKLFITSISVVTFFIPAIIIAICYIAIIYIIWSKGQSNVSGSRLDRMSQSSGSSVHRLTINASRHDSGRGIIPQAKIRTIKMTLIIVIVFTLCWSPFFLYNLLDVYEMIPKSNRLSTFIQSAAPLNSAANPIIYGIFSTRICRNLRRIPMIPCLRKAFCRCKDNKDFPQRPQHGRAHRFLASHSTDPTLSTQESTKRALQLNGDIRMWPLHTGRGNGNHGRKKLSSKDKTYSASVSSPVKTKLSKTTPGIFKFRPHSKLWKSDRESKKGVVYSNKKSPAKLKEEEVELTSGSTDSTDRGYSKPTALTMETNGSSVQEILQLRRNSSVSLNNYPVILEVSGKENNDLEGTAHKLSKKSGEIHISFSLHNIGRAPTATAATERPPRHSTEMLSISQKGCMPDDKLDSLVICNTCVDESSLGSRMSGASSPSVSPTQGGRHSPEAHCSSADITPCNHSQRITHVADDPVTRSHDLISTSPSTPRSASPATAGSDQEDEKTDTLLRDRYLATRRPTGVPSVRKRLDKGDNQLLHSVTQKLQV